MILLRDDGYVNATYLAKKAGKKVQDWSRLKRTKLLAEKIALDLNIPSHLMIQSKCGGNHQGSWIHELLVPDFAQWCSIDFSTKVAVWINEWKSLNNNKEIFETELKLIKNTPYYSTEEKEIQLKLQSELGGLIEVENEFGYIDLLTADEVIEIKEISKWKSALGQVLVYGSCYPTYRKRLHLFGDIKGLEVIRSKCQEFNVIVSIESYF